MKAKRKSFLYRNGLSVVMLSLFALFIFGHLLSGWQVKNEELSESNLPAISLLQYVQNPHFIQSTFENWESEFLQMCLYIILTVSLRQKGSSESKKLEGEEEVDREPVSHLKAPWPVKKGGVWLKLYRHSLSIAFALLFALSFFIHFIASIAKFNEEQSEKHLPGQSWNEYFLNANFWFESFQNWQSEFLAVGALVLLTIWLREKGSPQSKPVDAAHDEES